MKTKKLLNIDFGNEKINYDISNDVSIIRTKMLQFTSFKEIKKYMTEFLLSTWNNVNLINTDMNKSVTNSVNLTNDELYYLFEKAVKGEFLPTFMETIRLTFRIENINWHDITHLTRYRGFSLAAECSGDKVITDRYIGNPFDEGTSEFKKYNNIIDYSMSLYEQLINDNKTSIQDARLVLPRTTTTFYYVSCNLRDLINFISHRKDRQIQPKSDNILALLLARDVIKAYPMLKNLIIDKLNTEDRFYINESKDFYRSGFFKPDDVNKNEITKDNDYNYDERCHLKHQQKFIDYQNEIIDEIEKIDALSSKEVDYDKIKLIIERGKYIWKS